MISDDTLECSALTTHLSLSKMEAIRSQRALQLLDIWLVSMSEHGDHRGRRLIVLCRRHCLTRTRIAPVLCISGAFHIVRPVPHRFSGLRLRRSLSHAPAKSISTDMRRRVELIDLSVSMIFALMMVYPRRTLSLPSRKPAPHRQ